MRKCELHDKPHRHIVLDPDSWLAVKQQDEPERFDPYALGQIGQLTATPVYIDECPWHCTEGVTDYVGVSQLKFEDLITP